MTTIANFFLFSGIIGTSFAASNDGNNYNSTQSDSIKGYSASLPCDYSCSTSSRNHDMGSNGLNLLTYFEGFSSTCYKDSVGVWTIGYGHACQDNSDDLPQYGNLICIYEFIYKCIDY